MRSRGLVTIILSVSVGACGTASGAAPGAERPRGDVPMAAASPAIPADMPRREGLRTARSANDFPTTVERARAAIESRGLGLVAEIDHGANAERVGMELRPTTVLVFGNPEVGTRLMEARRSMGLDLPMKLLVWEDEDGKVHLAYDDPLWLAERHGVRGMDELLERMRGVLGEIAAEAGAR